MKCHRLDSYEGQAAQQGEDPVDRGLGLRSVRARMHGVWSARCRALSRTGKRKTAPPWGAAR